MSYYNNHKVEYKYLIETIASKLKKNVLMIEKDLIQTLFLYEISKTNNGIVFKGGTSLSKAYKLINRFSEDIDLSIDHKPTESEKRNINELILKIAQGIDLQLTNGDIIKSRFSYNKYVFKYDSLFVNVPQEIIIETNFYHPVYPTKNMEIHSFIKDFLNDKDIKIPEFLYLPNFKMTVQSLERTLIDKVFAICDYYLENMAERDSRHLYDIYKIIPYITFNDELHDLIKKVRLDCSKSKNNPSANENINVQSILIAIKEKEFYLNDYNNVTKKLLYEDVSYEQCINDALDIIIKSEFWIV